MRKGIITITVICAILLGSCKKFLNEEPLASVAVSQFYRTAKDMNAAMAGMYGNFQQVMVGEAQFKNKYTFWGEARSDNYERGGNSAGAFNEIQLSGLTAGNEFADWTPLYRVINIANMNIKFFPKIAETETNKLLVTPTIINNNLAQSYAIRAISYFYVIRTWGDAVIRLEPYEDIAQAAEGVREPQAKVIDEVIIPDLLKAYDLISKTGNPNVFNISEGAICAIMMDVYMWRKDYPNAIKWFQNLAKAKAPTGKVYTATTITDLEPTATWNNIFAAPASSREAIWNIHWNYSQNACACMAGVSTSPNNTPLIIDRDIYLNWRNTNPTDIRVRATFDITKTERDRVWKYYKGTYGPSGPGGVPGTYTVADVDRTNLVNVYLTMYRLADQYLLYAEALNKTGDKTNSLKYLNFVRNRAGMPSYIANDPQVDTQDKLEDVIVQERQWELFAEGKRWFDLVRTDNVISFMDPIISRRQIALGINPVTGWGTDKRKYLWPLNRNVLNSNRLLVQNPPYSD